MATPSSVDISELTKGPSKKLGGIKIDAVTDKDPYINMLIYGDPGAGKTVLAGSAQAVADMSPVLIVDVEGGSFSLRDFYPTVEVARVVTWQDLYDVYMALYKGEGGYKTIVLDSLTELQKLSMQTIMKEVVAKEPERDPEVPSIREWGKNGEQTRRFVRAFRDLPANVIFTCLVVNDKDQKTGKIMYRPSLSGKLSLEVAGYMDIVVFAYSKMMKVDEQDKICRFLLTGMTDTHVAKDRSNRLPQVVEDPSMETIHKYIFTGD